MGTFTLYLYTVARTWLRFDGFDPYNTAPRIVDNMSEVRYQREWWQDAPAFVREHGTMGVRS